MLMFIGASAGSTGGGLKVSRIIILVKTAVREIASLMHPRGIKIVKLDKKQVDPSIIKTTASYFIIGTLIYVASVLIVSLDGFDMITSLTSVAATLNNIGPGLELVGPTGNYAMFSPLAKLVMTFDMLAGRLEFFPMLVLFSPSVMKDGASTIYRKVKRTIAG